MAAIAIRNAQTALQQTHEQHLVSLLEELARLAECRQVTISQQTFAIYAQELLVFELCDVREALRAIGRRPRPAYQTAFPDLGTLISAAENARTERLLPAPIPAFDTPFILCDREHFLGHRVYVDVAGEPCDAHESPNRVLGLCRCWRDWMAKCREWDESCARNRHSEAA